MLGQYLIEKPIKKVKLISSKKPKNSNPFYHKFDQK